LPESERQRLYSDFEPMFPDFIGEHITLAFGVGADYPLPEAERGEVVGFASDGLRVEALIVRINGTTTRPDGKTFHITWSIDRANGAKPYHSNEVIRTGTRADLDEPIAIRIIPARFATR
jgi:hypothetical protein